MTPRFLSVLSLASALLLGTLGCAKKENPTPAPSTSSTGSYKLDGRLVKCTASAQLKATATGQNYLFVRLTTTPQPAGGEEFVELRFTKAPSRPTAEYKSEEVSLIYTNAPGQSLGFYPSNINAPASTNNVVTIADANNGGYSGTFSVTSFQRNHVLTEGVFTDARL